MIAYLVTNTLNGKQYVGISRQVTPVHRWARHLWSAMSSVKPSQLLLHKAIRRYGAPAFTIRTIGAAISWSELCILEQETIATYRTSSSEGGYNLTLGGSGSLGVYPSARTRETMAQRKRGTKQSPEVIQRRMAPRIGRKLSPEHIANLVGHECSAVTRHRIAESNRARSRTKETKARHKVAASMREARKMTEQEWSFICGVIQSALVSE